MDIKATTIGSLPISPSAESLRKAYFEDTDFDPWLECIERSTNFFRRAGLDGHWSDGQTRDDYPTCMRAFDGIRIRARTEVVEEIQHNPMSLNDLLYAKKIAPNAEFKGIVLGPHTIAKSVADFYYRDEKELSFALANALKEEIKSLEPHVTMIQIDEPMFSYDFPEYGKSLIETLSQSTNLPVALHVCGDAAKVFPNLTEIKRIDFLFHEFMAQKQLLEVASQYSFNQRLGIGCARSDNSYVESADEIYKHLQKAVGFFGDKVAYVSPDCGQRKLPKASAFQKLCNIVEAKNKILAES